MLFIARTVRTSGEQRRNNANNSLYMNNKNDKAIAGLENDIREMKFGTIGGLMICNGRIREEALPRKRYTRKPRSSAPHDPQSGSINLFDALQDFRRDIEELRGDWAVTIKVAHSLPLSWDREPVGSS